jgi:mono/diheme cytochrome c family protein
MSAALNCLLVVSAGMAALLPSQKASEDDSTWAVPEDARAVPNPLPVNVEVIEEGAHLYQLHCRSCHGDGGKGDGPMTKYVKPAPADFSTPEAQDRMTDGEIFYKISAGKNPMPRFKGKLKEEKRWILVHYVRKLKAG